MICLFVNLKEPFVNPSKTNNQCRKIEAVHRLLALGFAALLCKGLYHLILMMVAQIIEYLVYVYCHIHIFCKVTHFWIK